MRRISNIEKIIMIAAGVLAALICLELFLRLPGVLLRETLPAEMESSAGKDKKIYRIICLGDSWTNDVCVKKSQRYPEVLEKILNSNNYPGKFKVYNLGFPNFNSTMVLRKFKDAYPALRPDAVVIMMGRSDEWNLSGFESASLHFADKIKLMFLKSKIGELAAIVKYNINHRISGWQKSRGIAPKQEIQKKSLNKLYELVAQGNLSRSKGMYAQAIASYESALKLFPENIVALLEMSRCYKLQQKYDRAIVLLERILKQDAENETIYTELDNVFISLNAPNITVGFYEKLFLEYPQNSFIKKRLVNAFIVLADTMFERELYDRTIENYLNALSLDAENENIHNGLIYNLAIMHKAGKNAQLKDVINVNGDSLNPTGRESSIKKKASDNFSRNLKEIISVCKRENIKLIFSGYPKEMPDLMREHAYVFNIPLVDHRPVFERLLSEKEEAVFFRKDGHCSPEGYQVVAVNIAGMLLELPDIRP